MFVTRLVKAIYVVEFGFVSNYQQEPSQKAIETCYHTKMEVSKSQHMLFFVFFKHEEGVFACKVYHIRRYVFAS